MTSEYVAIDVDIEDTEVITAGDYAIGVIGMMLFLGVIGGVMVGLLYAGKVIQ